MFNEIKSLLQPYFASCTYQPIIVLMYCSAMKKMMFFSCNTVFLTTQTVSRHAVHSHWCRFTAQMAQNANRARILELLLAIRCAKLIQLFCDPLLCIMITSF